ncbi:gamma-glutamyltransferase family protein [Candidatus Spongiisocius sp.]|uniref:gamma-glutamyltransferase family protein n=1 Tax=Candidatus Spongiisocius sp. TaxID=3101273 RepID=UPI003B5CFA9A
MTHPVPVRTARGFGAAAVAPHELSTLAAIEVMEGGGNAVDGAIAANAVQGTVAPETCGIGGDLFALVHRPGLDSPACLNSSGRAGSGADASALREAGHTTMPLYGAPTVTVPGCVDGWHALTERYGALPLSEVLRPAIRLAEGGFPASRELSGAWTANAAQLLTQASAPPMFPDGRPPAVGQRISRPFLAGSLRAAAAGRDAFYLDRVGTAIPEATGNLITREDLARCQARWVAPLSAELFGRTAWTTPPNSQGYLTLATLSIFEQLDPTGDPEHPDYWHALIEAYRSMAWERDHCLYDPDTGPDLAMLDPEKLAERANRIDPAAAGSWRRPVPAAGGTAYMCAVDGDGMGVSLIQSNFHGIGSGLSAGRTGVWLHNRGAGFNLIPGHPNEWRPGRRPLHTLSPTIWTEGNRLALILGTRGGHQQPQLLAQVGAHMHHAGLEPGVAQAVPRWIIRDINATSSVLSVESRTDQRTIDSLRTRGHGIGVEGPWEAGWGPISAIAVSAGGLREAVADPRLETALALSL